MARRSRAIPPLDPTLDIVFRRFFGDPEASDLLIDFLTAVLDPPSPILTVDFSPTVLPGDTSGAKQIVLDVYVVLDSGDRINIEMQGRPEEGFEPRVAFYWSRSLGSSLTRGQSYEELPRSVFIGILDFVWDEREPPHVVIRPRTNASRMFTDRFEAHLLQLPMLPSLEALDSGPRDGHPSLTDWFRFFRARTDTERVSLAKRSPIMQRAHDRLVHLATDADLRAAVEKHEDDRFIIEHYRAKAMKKAVAEAVAEASLKAAHEGEQRGIVIAERRDRIAFIRELCAAFSIPIDERREHELDTMSTDVLDAVRRRILASREWPTE